MRTVLFVCVENAGRSQMAEALFNRYAEGRFRAISAGTNPGKQVHPAVVEALNEIGTDISGKKPRLVTADSIGEADRIITMGCGADFCPVNFLPKVEDWALEDPKGKPIEKVREIRDDIEKKVKALIEELRREES